MLSDAPSVRGSRGIWGTWGVNVVPVSDGVFSTDERSSTPPRGFIAPRPCPFPQPLLDPQTLFMSIPVVFNPAPFPKTPKLLGSPLGRSVGISLTIVLGKRGEQLGKEVERLLPPQVVEGGSVGPKLGGSVGIPGGKKETLTPSPPELTGDGYNNAGRSPSVLS